MHPSRDNPYLIDTLEDTAVVFKPEEGEVLRARGVAITLKVTSKLSNDQLGVYVVTLEPRTVGAQLHYHRFMDKTFIVNEGVLSVQHGKEKVDADAGSIIYIPRFTPHGFTNHSDKPVTVTLIFNPAQKREDFFRGLVKILNSEPVNNDEFLALYNKYDSFPTQ